VSRRSLVETAKHVPQAFEVHVKPDFASSKIGLRRATRKSENGATVSEKTASLLLIASSPNKIVADLAKFNTECGDGYRTTQYRNHVCRRTEVDSLSKKH
jgi:hypothetical protein